MLRSFTQVSVLLVPAVLGGCDSASGLGDRIAGRRASPFALYSRNDMRAGLRFEVLQEAAKKESVKPYTCMPLWAGAQRCSVTIESGPLTAIVDSSARVIRLVASTAPLLRSGVNVHGQLILRDVVRETRVSWDSVGSVHRDGFDGDAPQLRWLDRGGRWGASLWYSRAHRADVPRSSEAAMDAELAASIPESIGVTDLPAYALLMERRPPTRAAKTTVNRAVAAPRMPPTREEVLIMLRSDLRALTIAEEGAVHSTGRYETRLDRLSLTRSEGVSVELVQPTENGWSAVGTHPLLPGVSCVVFAGYVPSPPATRKQGRRSAPGDVVCDQP